MTNPSHRPSLALGTRSSYVKGCRCPDCTRANSDYQRRFMRGRLWQVDGERIVVRDEKTRSVLMKLDRLGRA